MRRKARYHFGRTSASYPPRDSERPWRLWFQRPASHAGVCAL